MAFCAGFTLTGGQPDIGGCGKDLLFSFIRAAVCATFPRISCWFTWTLICTLISYVALKAQLLLPQVSSAIERHISDSSIVGFLSDSQEKSYAKPDNFVWLANRVYS